MAKGGDKGRRREKVDLVPVGATTTLIMLALRRISQMAYTAFYAKIFSCV